MSKIDEKHPTPNFWFGYTALTGSLAWHVWPKGEAYFGTWMLAGILGVAAVGGFTKGISNLRRDYLRRKIYKYATRASGVFGSARYACVAEEHAASLHDPNGMLLLGLSRSIPCWLPRGLSFAVQAPPGAGKTSTLVMAGIFHAAQTGRSVVVSDCKPELVYLLAEPLRACGFTVVINNSGLLRGFQHDNSNPFEELKRAVADPESQGDVFTMAEALARALIPEIKADKNEFFRSLERQALVFVLIALAGFEPENCYPAQVWQALTNPKRFKDLCAQAQQSDALNGDLAALAESFIAQELDNPEHFNTALTGAANALSVFKTSSTLGMVGASHDFDPASLRDVDSPPTVVFDVMPADKLSVFGKANALMQTARLQTLKRCREGRDVVFMVDEAVNLPVPTVVEEIELARSFGITMCLFYQSWNSLKRVYGEDRAESIRASCAEMYFGIGDVKTAEEISKRSGEYTVKTNSQSFDEHGKPSENIGEAKQHLLPVDEILSLPRHQALLFVSGVRPVKLNKLPWFETEPFKSLADENPHEQHPKSRVTRLTLDYGEDASELRPPVIDDLERRLTFARRHDSSVPEPIRVSPITLRSMFWVPWVALAASIVVLAGTPHVVFEYEIRKNAAAAHACTYVGLSGFRRISVSGPCPKLKLIRHQREYAR